MHAASRADHEARIPESPGRAGEPDRITGQPGVDRPREVHARTPEELSPRVPIGDDHLGCLRGSRGTRVRRKIDEGHVDVVSHCAHDGDAAAGHRANDRLVVERTEILRRSATASDDDHVDLCDALELRHRAADRFGSTRALDLCWGQKNACSTAAERHPADVVNDSSGGARHDADGARVSW
jgi:hypothetical protein